MLIDLLWVAQENNDYDDDDSSWIKIKLAVRLLFVCRAVKCASTTALII